MWRCSERRSSVPTAGWRPEGTTRTREVRSQLCYRSCCVALSEHKESHMYSFRSSVAFIVGMLLLWFLRIPAQCQVTFFSPPTYTVVGPPLFVADFNGDGKLDLLGGIPGQGGSLQLGNGDCTVAKALPVPGTVWLSLTSTAMASLICWSKVQARYWSFWEKAMEPSRRPSAQTPVRAHCSRLQ